VRDLTAFILAGGQSRRMGEDKAFLEIGGRLLIDQAMRRLKVFDCDIFLVGPKAKFNAFGRILEDHYANAGPLAGIHSALTRSESIFNLITPVDMPLLTSPFLEALVEKALASDAEVVITKTADGLQPLCGVYRKTFFKTADTALKQKKYKIDAAVMSSPYELFDAQAAGFPGELFLNVNTPEDLKTAERYYQAHLAKAAHNSGHHD
jgi:molybdopterin-guanine dinucleotide biosynthesis protein A